MELGWAWLSKGAWSGVKGRGLSKGAGFIPIKMSVSSGWAWLKRGVVLVKWAWLVPHGDKGQRWVGVA